MVPLEAGKLDVEDIRVIPCDVDDPESRRATECWRMKLATRCRATPICGKL